MTMLQIHEPPAGLERRAQDDDQADHEERQAKVAREDGPNESYEDERPAKSRQSCAREPSAQGPP